MSDLVTEKQLDDAFNSFGNLINKFQWRHGVHTDSVPLLNEIRLELLERVGHKSCLGNHGVKWSDSDVICLLELDRQGQTLDQLSQRFGRKPESITSKLESLRLKEFKWSAMVFLRRLREGLGVDDDAFWVCANHILNDVALEKLQSQLMQNNPELVVKLC